MRRLLKELEGPRDALRGPRGQVKHASSRLDREADQPFAEPLDEPLESVSLSQTRVPLCQRPIQIW